MLLRLGHYRCFGRRGSADKSLPLPESYTGLTLISESVMESLSMTSSETSDLGDADTLVV